MTIWVPSTSRSEFLRVAKFERAKVPSTVTGKLILDGNFVRQHEVQWILFPEMPHVR